MCCGAILQAHIPTVVYGVTDLRAGAAGTLFHLLADVRPNHRRAVRAGVLAAPSRAILPRFFQIQRRSVKK
jgi:tRNA(adenine34) deaminase